MSGFDTHGVCPCGHHERVSFGDLFFAPEVCPKCGRKARVVAHFWTDWKVVTLGQRKTGRWPWQREWVTPEGLTLAGVVAEMNGHDPEPGGDA